MIGLIALVSSASVTFSGYVPPHRAVDGRRYSLAVPVGHDVTKDMKACGIRDFRTLGSGDEQQTYQFAVMATELKRVACVRAALPANAGISDAQEWFR